MHSLRLLETLDRGVESSIISVHGGGFLAAIGLTWIGGTGIALHLMRILIIIVAGDDVSHVGFLGRLVRV